MQVGTLLDNRYRIDSQIGEGGMGIVFRAHDTLLDRPVAIKSLSPQLISPEGLKRLLREAQSAAKLSHPGIVATHDVVDDADGRFIVMELVEGKPLRDLIPRPWRDAVPLMRQVFEAIGFAHERSIVHRDLKPENIIVTSDGSAKIMDFGLARSEGRSRLTQTGLVVGTALYMAPEQALQGKAVPQSDLYALGCVFYELITGKPPFSGEDPLSIITQHINLAPRTPRQAVPDLSPAVEALILKLLAKDPGERPASAGDVARVLSLIGSPVRAPSGEQVEEMGPRVDRVRRVRLVGRSEALSRLRQHLDAAMLGRGALVVTSGEPGIGKTRVLEEVAAEARVRGFHVLTARCHERDVSIPYLPISDALQTLARTCPPELWKELLKAAGPEVSALLSDSLQKHISFGSVLPSDSMPVVATRVAEEVRPIRAFRNILARLSREGPVLFVMDDLHWADPPSLELIHRLALSTREIPVLILGAYREIELERTHPLSRLLVDLNRERLLLRERLRRLSASETAELLEALVSGGAPDGLAALAHEQTEGNPFFLEELVNGLVENGRLRLDEQGAQYALAPGVTIERLAGEVPQGIRAAIGARLEHLDAPAQQVLGLASVVGRSFGLDVLNRLAGAHGLTEEDVDQALRHVEAARFVTRLERRTSREADQDTVLGFTAGSPDLEADYAFDHHLIHQVVYSELDRRKRRRLHGELGYMLEELYRGETGLYAERLAYHFLESDDDAKAVDYSWRAGDKALRAYYDADIALNYYLPALEMVLMKDAALKRLAQRSPVPLSRGVVHRYSPEEREEVVAFLDEVLRAVRGTPPAGTVAQLASRISVAAMHLGSVYEASVQLYEETLLGPDTQKLVVETPHGKLVAILEFPGTGGPYPSVMLFHGSGGGKETVTEEAERYRRRGMATLRVDLPGFGETTVKATATLRDAEVLKEMITAALAHERVDERGVGIAGWSLGPWHAAQLAARDPRVRAVVSISGSFNPHDTRPGTNPPQALIRARMEAAYKAGKRASPQPMQPAPDTNVFEVAHQIRCPMLLVYGVLEPELYRAQAEELAQLVPTAQAQPWRSGVHVLRNVPEALEGAAEWMKQQLL